MGRARVGFWVAIGVSFLDAPARAYTINSPVTDGCHERITVEALRAVRRELVTAAPLATSREDFAVIDDLPVQLPADMRDIGAAALLVGVRDNDLKGLQGIDATALATVHGDPDGQKEHVLRRPEQDGAEGSIQALADSIAYISSTVTHAISGGLDPITGAPQPGNRTVVRVHLAIRGAVSPAFPIFYIYIGQALHTLQDSFSHTYRSKDLRRIHVVLNWIDFAEDRLNERRDGPRHSQTLDQCDGLDAQRRDRLTLATVASTALLHAALDPRLDVDMKSAAVTQILKDYMTLEGEAGSAAPCTFENRWCDAPERAYADPLGCAIGGRRTRPALLPVAAVVGLFFTLRRRRARKCLQLISLLGAVALSSRAMAQDKAACVPGQQISCGCAGGTIGTQICVKDGTAFGECRHCAGASVAAATPVPAAAPIEEAVVPSFLRGPTAQRFGLYAAIGASNDHPAVASAIGWRYRLGPNWLTGIDAEWNPWASWETRRFRAGALNVSAAIIRRYHLTPWISARSSLHLGTSTLLFNLYGAPSGSLGPYVALSWLGLEMDLGRGWRIVLDPVEIALPVPHVSGVPLFYNQYRFVVGFQFGA